MYGPGQIIYDLDNKEPVKLGDNWDAASYPKRHTHFIRPTGRFWNEISEYVVACPSSVAEAKRLLKENKIAPAPEESQLEVLEVPTITLRRMKHELLQKVQQVLEAWL